MLKYLFIFTGVAICHVLVAQELRLTNVGLLGHDINSPEGKYHSLYNSSRTSPHLRLTEDAKDFARILFESNQYPGSWILEGVGNVVSGSARFGFYYADPSTPGHRLMITGNGRVGINTITPLYDLDVRGLDNTNDGGELQLATPDQTNFLRFFGGRLGDRNPFMAFTDTDTFHIASTSSNWLTFTRRMTILPSGNVGIGTSNPLAKLDITAIGDGAEILRLSTERPWVFKQQASGASTKLTLQTTSNGKAFEILSEDGMNRAAVFFSGNGHSNVLLVPDGGEAGVGVEDPLAKFHIKHNSTSGWPHLTLTEVGQDFARLKLESDSDPGTFWDIAGQTDTLLENSRLNFHYAGPNGSGDRMTIRGNGNVGIGTTHPATSLHIKSSNFAYLAVESENTSDAVIQLRDNSAGSPDDLWTIRRDASDGGKLQWRHSNFPKMTLTPGGSFGIGTTNPTTSLHVVGGMKVDGTTFNVDPVNNRVTIGTETGPAGYRLAVDGMIIAEGMRVQLSGDWPDYVFGDAYELMPLDRLEASICEHNHLPGVPSAEQVKAEGIDLGEMQTVMMEKIEELTLYIIMQEKRIRELESRSVCDQ